MDMNEFTTSRIKGLIQVYMEINTHLEQIIKNTLPDTILPDTTLPSI